MDYTDIENSIVDRLKVLYDSDGIVVVNIPQNQSEYDRPFSKGRITVGYSGSDFGPDGSLRSSAEMVQEECLDFMITIQARSLRELQGIHKVAVKVKKMLLGFKPVHCDRLIAKKFGFEDPSYFENLWSFSMCFSCKALAVQEYPDDLDEFTVTQINFDNIIS